jgi:c-di-GMP-binding flagellar brake protein YcgR
MSEEKPMQYSGAERRNFKRVKVNLIVVYREDESLDVRIRTGNQERQATMVDISEEGVAVLTDVNIPVTTMLCIRFNLADNKKNGIDFYGAEDIKGKVLYAAPSDTGHFRIGIQFCDLTKNDRIQIKNFVDIIEKRFSSGDQTNQYSV